METFFDSSALPRPTALSLAVGMDDEIYEEDSPMLLDSLEDLSNAFTASVFRVILSVDAFLVANLHFLLLSAIILALSYYSVVLALKYINRNGIIPLRFRPLFRQSLHQHLGEIPDLTAVSGILQLGALTTMCSMLTERERDSIIDSLPEEDREVIQSPFCDLVLPTWASKMLWGVDTTSMANGGISSENGFLVNRVDAKSPSPPPSVVRLAQSLNDTSRINFGEDEIFWNDGEGNNLLVTPPRRSLDGTFASSAIAPSPLSLSDTGAVDYTPLQNAIKSVVTSRLLNGCRTVVNSLPERKLKVATAAAASSFFLQMRYSRASRRIFMGLVKGGTSVALCSAALAGVGVLASKSVLNGEGDGGGDGNGNGNGNGNGGDNDGRLVDRRRREGQDGHLDDSLNPGAALFATRRSTSPPRKRLGPLPLMGAMKAVKDRVVATLQNLPTLEARGKMFAMLMVMWILRTRRLMVKNK